MRLLLRLFLDFDNLQRIRGKGRMLAKTDPITGNGKTHVMNRQVVAYVVAGGTVTYTERAG